MKSPVTSRNRRKSSAEGVARSETAHDCVEGLGVDVATAPEVNTAMASKETFEPSIRNSQARVSTSG